MRMPRPLEPRPRSSVTMPRPLRLLCAGLLGVLAAVLVSCGSSGAGLIPAQNADPLLSDFQAVERAAREGNGDCTATETAILTTERDYQRLPVIDAGLRGRLHEGIAKLHELALEMCAQLHPQTTTTGAATSTTKAPPPTSTTTTETPTTPTSTTQTSPPTGTTPGATQTSGAEGGTPPAVGGGEGQPGEGGEGEGKHEDSGVGNGGVSGNGGTGSAGHGGER